MPGVTASADRRAPIVPVAAPQVPAVIIGARNAEHVGDLQRLFSFELTDSDLEAIAGALAGGARSTGDCYSWERGGAW